jgi:addiction module RelE/StbE family toxin
MAYQIIWSPEALDDIDEIAAHIAKDSPHYAHSVVEQLINASRTLSVLPERARVVPELHDDAYRELFIYSYRLIYYLEEEQKKIKISAVIHGASLLSADRFS